MKLEQIRHRIDIKFNGYGHYLISLEKKGKIYRGVTNNTIAMDRINNKDLSKRQKDEYGYTLKQAYQALINCINF